MHIGIDGDHICSFQSVEYYAVERVQTGSAHADDFDRNKLCQAFWETVVFVKLNHDALPVVNSAAGRLAAVIPSEVEESRCVTAKLFHGLPRLRFRSARDDDLAMRPV